MQETSQIRGLMYCKSAICKSGQFELNSVIKGALYIEFKYFSDGIHYGLTSPG